MHRPQRIDQVLILGGGSAGFLAAVTLKIRNPQLSVLVLRSPDMGIAGVGESTTTGIPTHLHQYFDIGELCRLAEPTLKLGIRFLWGKRPYFDCTFAPQLDAKYSPLTKNTGFYCPDGPTDYIGISSALMTENKVWARQPNGQPLIGNDFAFDIENSKFVVYLEHVARRLGVAIQDDTVVDVLQNEAGVAGLLLASGSTLSADLFIDCSGFKSLLLGQALKEPYCSYRSSLFCDRAVVGEWQRTDEPVKPHTTAETMDAGWCWRIEHEDYINRGYVYAGDFINDSEAEAEFRKKNPKIGPTRIVKFKSGRSDRGWVKNVLAVGSASGFVEPLESTGLGVAMARQSHFIADTLAGSDRLVWPSLVKQYNKQHCQDWDAVRRFLVLPYKFNTRLETPFWKACRADADLADAGEIVDYYQENGPSFFWREPLFGDGDRFSAESFLAMLLGQQVPHRNTFTPSESEWATWQSIRAQHYVNAKHGIDTAEALRMIRTPGFVWPEHLYQHLLVFRPGSNHPDYQRRGYVTAL